MPIAALGHISLSEANLCNAVARSAVVQVWMGVDMDPDPEASVLARCYIGEMPGRDEGVAYWEGLRPFVQIRHDESFVLTRKGRGNRNDYTGEGATRLRFEANADTGLNAQDMHRDFFNVVGLALVEIAEVDQGAGDVLDIESIEEIESGISKEEWEATHGIFYSAEFSVAWGGE